MKRSRLVTMAGAVVSALVMSLGMGVAPAGAAAPTQQASDKWFAFGADGTNNLVFFWNTTRTAFCTPTMIKYENDRMAWLADPSGGPEPTFPDVTSAVPVTETSQDVGQGNVQFGFTGNVPVELWTFEGGKSAANMMVGPCTDTDGIVDGTTQPTTAGVLFASGYGRWTFSDSDLTGAGPRMDIYSFKMHASLMSPSGTSYRYDARLWYQGRYAPHRDRSLVSFKLS